MTPEQPSEQHDNATAEKVGAWLRTAWTRMTAKSSEGGEALPAPSRHPVLAKDTVRQRVESELYAMTVRAVESEVTVERLELELANAKAEIERLTEAELKARTRAGQEERAAFEAALKPMTELGQSLVKWAESWGNRLNAQLVSDLDTLSTAMQPLAHDMREIYRDAGATYGDTEDGMLRWWGGAGRSIRVPAARTAPAWR